MDSLITADGRVRVWRTFQDVSPDALYSYWTEPAKLTQWWPNEATLDAVPEGAYRYVFSGGTLAGSFSEAEEGRRLAFSWRWEHEPGTPEQQVVVDFERRDDDTLLTVTQGPYGRGAEAEERGRQLESWQYLLKRLNTVCQP